MNTSSILITLGFAFVSFGTFVIKDYQHGSRFTDVGLALDLVGIAMIVGS